ncbi:MAG: amino acid adenylation domain-containing protein, partial [bacterium]|nr:amino acid adenylation domain-containing protein [bacterium]
PCEKSLHRLFEEQAAKTPHHIALEMESRCITYHELNKRANRLAGILRRHGVKQGSIVGVLLTRSLRLITGVFAILKAGGSFLNLDPKYPKERLNFMINDTGLQVLLTRGNVHEKETRTRLDPNLLTIDPDTYGHAHVISSQDSTGIGLDGQTSPSAPGDPAYIIYTSGSTGTPKGVLGLHKGMVNRFNWMWTAYPFKPNDVCCQKTSMNFVDCIWEIFGPLLKGVPLVIIPGNVIIDLPAFVHILKTRQVTRIVLVPGLLYRFFDGNTGYYKELSRLTFWVSSGEALQPGFPALFRESAAQNILLNLYGSSEISADVTCYNTTEGREEGLSTIPIGRPIDNAQIYILNGTQSSVPIGVAGEIYAGGDGLAAGYLNQPELTARRFVPNPFKESSGALLFRTGDLGRYLADGVIEYFGRKDQQVKIRGFRVEPGEIEIHLLRHDDIKEAVVVPRKDHSGEYALCAYFISDKNIAPASLKEFLSHTLPNYMVPSFFVPLDQIPLTPTGKIHRRALPEPVIEAGGNYIAPANEMEVKLAGIWSGLLGIAADKISINDSFFHLGGHSLKAVRLISRIQKALNVEVPLGQLFKYPTIKGLSIVIEGFARKEFVSIPAVEKRDYYPLSSAQRRLSILHRLDPGGIGYNIPALLMLEGRVDKNRLENTFKQLIGRHQSLRTSFHMIDNQPVQRVHDHVEMEIEYFGSSDRTTQCSPLNGNNSNSGSHGGQPLQSQQDFVRPFDLSKAPLLRVGLIKQEETKHLLVVDMHHIISDGTSVNIIAKDFMALYGGRELPAQRLQYKDFSQWQGLQNQNDQLKQQETYWIKEFSTAGEIPALGLPTDYSRPALQSFEGSRVYFEIDPDGTHALKEYALREGVTLYMLLLSLYTIFLSRVTGQEDVVVGTPVAGRNHVDLESIVGMFVNTLPLRNYPSGRETVTRFIHQVKERTLTAFHHQDYMYEDLVEVLVKDRDTSRNPLFDTLFVLQNFQQADLELPGLTLKQYDYEWKVAKFDLTLEGVETGEKLTFVFDYCTGLFKEDTVIRFAGYFKNILSAVVNNPRQRLLEIDIIPEEEKKQVLYDFNDTAAPYPSGKTIHRLIREQVERTPDGVAVVSNKATLTYRELNNQSQRLAGLLKEKGVRIDTIVAIMAGRCLEMIIGKLGILNAGGAFLPVDPEYPEERIDYMLRDSGSNVLVSGLDGLVVKRLDASDQSTRKPINRQTNKPTNLAYVIYTSGSTGKPKGVMLRHQGISSLNNLFKEKFKVDKRDRIVQFAAGSFDASVWEMTMALLNGAALVLVGSEIIGDYEEFQDFVSRHRITIATLPPAYANHLDPVKVKPLRLLVTAGSSSSSYLVDKWSPHLQYINAYGPTETTVCTTVWYADGRTGPLETVPIGKPITNTQIYILDTRSSDLHIQPIGVAGELCVAGVSLARGYLNRPELTAERFINSKLQTTNYKQITNYKSQITNKTSAFFASSAVIYKTGDLSRWLPEGNIEFLGRIDHQVKVRGFRIELGEIENRLLNHPDIKEAVVLCPVNREAETYLAAYIVVDKNLSPTQVKEFLSLSLPHYMVPSYITILDQIPLTPSGKVNPKALPGPDAGTEEGYQAPRDETERELLKLWSDLLGPDALPAVEFEASIGINDNFFALGGHSLKAALLAAGIHRLFNVKMSLMELFKRPTIKEISRYIKDARRAGHITIEPSEEKEYYPLSSAQRRLYILRQMEKMTTGYNLPALLILEGHVDTGRLERAFKHLIRRHESLRTSFTMIAHQPVQIVREAVEFEIEYFDLAANRVNEREEKDENIIIEGFIRPFDLSDAPLLRVGLIKQAERKHILMIDMHHIISDGTSVSIMAADFMALYGGRELPGQGLQYKDFSQWQGRPDQKKQQKKQEKYWLNEFSTQKEIPLLALPTDYPRPKVQEFEGSRVYFEIDKDGTHALKEYALKEGVTLYMVLLSLYTIFLSRVTRQEDIVVGTPVAGRNHADLETIIGMFVNTLPLRNYPSGRETVARFIHQVKERTLTAFDHQDYTYEDLVETLVKNRDTSRNPLFDTMFVLQNFRQADLELPDLTLKPYDYQWKISKFDLTLTATETPEHLSFSFEYGTRLFKSKTIHRFTGFFKRILDGVLQSPGMEISQIQLISPGEKEQLLYGFNDTAEEVPADKTTHQMVEDQTEKTPDNIALILKDQALTYRQLNQKANSLAWVLVERGTRHETLAALIIERSLEMIIGILGILKAGGAYLP